MCTKNAVRQLTDDQIERLLTFATIQVTPTIEHLSPYDALESGDPAYKYAEHQTATELLKRLYDGDPWAWCCVRVTVDLHGLSAESYLGGCSYKDRDDFVENSGYYGDMVRECAQEIGAAYFSIHNAIMN